MKKSILFVFISLAGNLLFGQQIANAGFETWEVENGKTEPVNWSSIQTGLPVAVSNLAPKVIFESADAHSGSKSLKLENKSSFGIVANGIVTTGRVMADLDPTKAYIFTDIDDSRWNAPLNARPDSIAGWYKYEPSGADLGSVTAIIHTGSAKSPDLDSVNYIASAKFTTPAGTNSVWTRFSVPFTYFNSNNPEYILLNLTSGNGTQATDGSVGYFDDIELIYNTVDVQMISPQVTIKAYGGTNHIKIDLTSMNKVSKWEVKVYDILGKEQLKKMINSGEEATINQLIGGIYICVISDGEQVITKKVVVN